MKHAFPSQEQHSFAKELSERLVGWQELMMG